MNRIITNAVLIIILFSSCSKDDKTSDFITSGLQIPVITGYVMRDVQGETVAYIGDPNVNTAIWSESGYELITGVIGCPNPANEAIHFCLGNSVPTGTRFYMVKATSDRNFQPDVDFTGSVNFIAGSHPIFELYPDEQSINLVITDLPDGYYRAYFEGEDFLLWDNIVISHNYNPYNY